MWKAAAKVEARAVLKEAALTGVWKAAATVEARAVLKVAARAIHKAHNIADKRSAQTLHRNGHHCLQ